MITFALLVEPLKLVLAGLAGAICARWVNRQLAGSAPVRPSRRTYHGGNARGPRPLPGRSQTTPQLRAPSTS